MKYEVVHMETYTGTYETYLKVYTQSESVQEWWDNLSTEDKEIVMALPDFNADIFEQRTGIKVK